MKTLKERLEEHAPRDALLLSAIRALDPQRGIDGEVEAYLQLFEPDLADLVSSETESRLSLQALERLSIFLQDDAQEILATLIELQIGAQRSLESRRDQLLRSIAGLEAQQSRTFIQVGRAIQEIARGILEILPEPPRPHDFNAEELEKSLVGSTTKEDLKAGCPLLEDYAHDALARQTHQWLMEWIERSTDEQRVLFCKAVTGSRALPFVEPGRPAVLVTYVDEEASRVPTSHTCARQLDLPKNCGSYQTFRDRLEMFIQNAQEGFGFA